MAKAQAFYRLSHLYGGQTVYYDIEHRRAPWQRLTEPVVVAWEGEPAQLELRLPQERATGLAAWHLRLENGDLQRGAYDLGQLSTLRAIEIDGERYVAKGLTLPGPLPWGYHRLTLETGKGLSETLIISAPLKAYIPPEGQEKKAWGVLLPLYALRSRRSWGGGDLSDLGALVEWVAGLGGQVVATLPFFASFLGEPFDPSPYAPASRLF